MRTFATFLAFTMIATAAEKRPMTLDDLFAFKRVADPQISPDGKQVVYQVTEITDVATNKKHTHLWLAADAGNGPPRQITSSGKADTHPRWSPDGSKILFESTRSGTPQLYILDLKAGGEAVQITTISSGATNGIWSPDGLGVAFVSAVYPEFSELPFAESDKKNKEKNDAIEASPVKAKTFTKLFYRHWDEYVGDKRQHLFVMKFPKEALLHGHPLNWSEFFDKPRDVTPGDRDAFPTSDTFSSGDNFTFTPDSKHIVFTAVPAKNESWSTNYDLCRVGIDNKSKDWEVLTKDNPGADNGPCFSPDGKQLAWRSQTKAGYEADKWNIKVVDCKPDGAFAGAVRNITDSKDISTSEFGWFTNDAVLSAIEEKGASRLKLIDVKTGSIQHEKGSDPSPFRLPSGGQIGGLSIAHLSLPKFTFTQAFMNRPNDVCIHHYTPNPPVIFSGPGSTILVSFNNDDLLDKLDLPRPESVSVKTEDGEMQMWILTPSNFTKKKKWPLVYLIHGGPQGAWEDGWSFRWNPQLWAAQGYVVAMPNPRGSTGFGQKYVDEITGDWGGKCYRDLVAGLDYLKKLPYVDADRLATAGASFGGYMQMWFAVNDIAKNFKCQIAHDGVWNFESMWGTTDELWFDEWEHGGLPWEKPGKYREFSPHTRAGELGKNKVPMLIIHNDLDFRCPIGQGHEFFSALQRQGVPSRMVNFPDEGHWVLKPANSKHWHTEVFAWLKQYCPPGGK